ncbi:endonuclease V [Mucilaginibacter sp. ZT4R22]|uniref:Endonuclease V n=1 Tax=Mucilaginibacter pankratovii TaxID=2772110 RepID=A0ABR7WSE4_9SPHI|nr:endonuclease V [Mucilaginibacter pankratovii]MBD1365225.1 endonuclease V [Mucilaginibacter pankratovii]
MELRILYDDLQLNGFDIGGGPYFFYEGIPFTGTIVEYYNGGGIRCEEEVKDGHKDGAQREYYEDGKKKTEGFEQYNSPYGFFREWNESGDLTSQYYFGPKPNFNGTLRKKILAIDIYYLEDAAKAVGALFYWDDVIAAQTISLGVDNIEPYVPGEFYKRELPCILKVIEQADLEQIDLIIVDGNVYIDNEGSYGLGGKLWEALGGKIPVIGVAKTFFKNTEEKVIPVERGQSKNPLYVSAIGMDTLEASELIKSMKGEHRMPDILKYVDTLTKEA